MTTLEISVAASADDGYSTSVGNFSSDTIVDLVGNTDRVFDSFYRFLNVTVPQGATIVAAYLEVIASSSAALANVLTNIYADDTDDAVAPVGRVAHANKVRTTAFTAWDGPAAWVLGTTYQSPDIAAVIQEIVDRAGWKSGNALQVLWDDDGSPSSTHVRSYNWDDITYAAPLLHIEYRASDAQTLLLLGVG